MRYDYQMEAIGCESAHQPGGGRRFRAFHYEQYEGRLRWPKPSAAFTTRLGIWYRLDDFVSSDGHFRLHGLYLGRKQRPQTQCAYHLWRSADIQSVLVHLLFQQAMVLVFFCVADRALVPDPDDDRHVLQHQQESGAITNPISPLGHLRRIFNSRRGNFKLKPKGVRRF